MPFTILIASRSDSPKFESVGIFCFLFFKYIFYSMPQVSPTVIFVEITMPL